MPHKAKIITRKAEAADADAVVQMVADLSAHEGGGRTQFKKVQFLRDMVGENPPFTLLVADDGEDKAIGFILFYPGYDLATGTHGMHFGDLFVQEKHRRKGAAAALFKQMIQATLDAGGEWISWKALITNIEAYGFYSWLEAYHNPAVQHWAVGKQQIQHLVRVL